MQQCTCSYVHDKSSKIWSKEFSKEKKKRNQALNEPAVKNSLFYWILSLQSDNWIMVFDVKKLDIYRKIPKDLTQPTTTGAVISVCSVSFICLLLVSELYFFISPDVRSELHVDNANPTDRIPVRINISLPRWVWILLKW